MIKLISDMAKAAFEYGSYGAIIEEEDPETVRAGPRGHSPSQGTSSPGSGGRHPSSRCLESDIRIIAQEVLEAMDHFDQARIKSLMLKKQCSRIVASMGSEESSGVDPELFKSRVYDFSSLSLAASEISFRSIYGEIEG